MFDAWTRRGLFGGRKAYTLSSTIHSFRYLCLCHHHCPAPRLVRALSFDICIGAGVLTRAFPDCSSVSRKPTPFRRGSSLGALPSTVSFGWVRLPPQSRLFSSYVITDHLAFSQSSRPFWYRQMLKMQTSNVLRPMLCLIRCQ